MAERMKSAQPKMFCKIQLLQFQKTPRKTLLKHFDFLKSIGFEELY